MMNRTLLLTVALLGLTAPVAATQCEPCEDAEYAKNWAMGRAVHYSEYATEPVLERAVPVANQASREARTTLTDVQETTRPVVGLVEDAAEDAHGIASSSLVTAREKLQQAKEQVETARGIADEAATAVLSVTGPYAAFAWSLAEQVIEFLLERFGHSIQATTSP